MCLCEIPNLKHMLVTAGHVSLTSPSNVSPHFQLKVNFANLFRRGTASIFNVYLRFTETAYHHSVLFSFSKGVFVHFGKRG